MLLLIVLLLPERGGSHPSSSSLGWRRKCYNIWDYLLGVYNIWDCSLGCVPRKIKTQRNSGGFSKTWPATRGTGCAHQGMFS